MIKQKVNMNGVNICENNSFSFELYKNTVDKFLKTDWREVIIQNRIIIPFLDSLFNNIKDISIVDTSLQYRNKDTDSHDLSKYRSMEVGSAPPDVLIAKNWNYKNRNSKEIEYLSTIEIKSPSMDPIYDKDNSEYGNHTQREIKYHLEACSKVILTDCFRWHFFDRKDNETIIDLYDIEKGVWKTKIESNNEFRIEKSDFEAMRETEPDEWKLLCDFITKFINQSNNLN